MTLKPYTKEEWTAEAVRRFGSDSRRWKFRCPICGVVTCVQEWIDAGAEHSIAFACIGRFTKVNRKAFSPTADKTAGPCDYTGGGLFRMNPVEVELSEDVTESVFDFAD